jgi:hypothetical protein
MWVKDCDSDSSFDRITSIQKMAFGAIHNASEDPELWKEILANGVICVGYFDTFQMVPNPEHGKRWGATTKVKSKLTVAVYGRTHAEVIERAHQWFEANNAEEVIEHDHYVGGKKETSTTIGISLTKEDLTKAEG